MKKISLLLVVLTTLWGCATFSQNYKLGTQASLAKDWDAAVQYYESAYAENPKNAAYRLSLERAKVSASLAHFYAARRLASLDRQEEALEDYRRVTRRSRRHGGQ